MSATQVFADNEPLDVTEAEAAGIRKFLAALKPGAVMICCKSCKRVRTGGFVLTMEASDSDSYATCESCYNA